jgi:hypothetical protein
MRPIQLKMVVYVWFCETYKGVTSKPKKKDSDTITMKFLLHKDRIKK